MHKGFIAIILSAALAVTMVSAPPARAGNDGVAAFIAGVAALAVIAAAVEAGQDRDRAVADPKPPVRQAAPRLAPRPLPEAAHRQRADVGLPRSCLRQIETRRGVERVLGQRCLRQSWGNPQSLPRVCATSVQTRNGLRAGFRPGCLRQRGYRLASW